MQFTKILATILMASTSQLIQVTAAVVSFPSTSVVPASEIKIGDYDWGFTLFGNSNCDGFIFNFLGHGTRACQTVDMFHSWKPNATIHNSDKVVRLFSTQDCSGPTVAEIGTGYSADTCRQLDSDTWIRAFDVVDA